MRPTLPIVLLALTAGCAGAPEFEVGTGEERFEPLTEGDAVPMAMGAQGGWHLWVSVRARNIDPDAARVTIVTAPVGGRPRQTTVLHVDLEPSSGWYQHVGIPAVLSYPECFDGRDVTLRVEIADRGGYEETVELIVVPRSPLEQGPCEL